MLWRCRAARADSSAPRRRRLALNKHAGLETTGRIAAGDQVHQEVGGVAAHLLLRLPDGGQRRVAVGCQEQVVETTDRDIRRDAQTAVADRTDGPERLHVVVAEYGRRRVREIEQLAHGDEAALRPAVAVGDQFGRKRNTGLFEAV